MIMSNTLSMSRLLAPGRSVIPGVPIASGAMFGPTQSMILHLIEIEPALPSLNGVVMELDDGAFPLLKGGRDRKPGRGIPRVSWACSSEVFAEGRHGAEGSSRN
jgi:hypothetical protein